MLDIKKIRADFPILSRKVNGQYLIYLDNAATSQKPLQVMAAIDDYYETANANVHRGSHTLADEATSLYEKSREIVAGFIGAQKPQELIFVRNTTEAINLVACSYAEQVLQKNDEVLLGVWEHHSNLIPWQQVCAKTGAKLVYLNPTPDGQLDFKDYRAKLNSRTKLVTVAQASNVLGTIFPVSEMAAEAKKVGAVLMVDAAQSVPHMPVDVKSLGCDFLAFSGHKMLAPMGIGALYIRSELMNKLSPFLVGGGMINEVDECHTSWAEVPYRFEAGTPNVNGAIGFAAAVMYLKQLGMNHVRAHELELNAYALEAFQKIPAARILGPLDPVKRTGLLSFILGGSHGHDVAAILDQRGVAVRSGYHCAMPLHAKLKLNPTCRASWYLYNDKDDIDALV
ncbi:SufS family cysteine desulfurase, partial [Patescibacteria group bacterium]|nr:SufS family cysteine desulfurase [Patescibacteria group bacterium]